MNFKYDPGDCSCCDATGCCESKTTDCGDGYDPEERCCCICESAPPCEFDVTIGGIANPSEDCGEHVFGRQLGNCSNCTNYNGTYSVTKFWSNNAAVWDYQPKYASCEWWGFFNCDYDSTWPQCGSCSTEFIVNDQINMIRVYITAEGKIVCQVWDTFSHQYWGEITNWCKVKVSQNPVVFLKDTLMRVNGYFAGAIVTYSGQLSTNDEGESFVCDVTNLSLSYDSDLSRPGRVGNIMCDWTGLTVSISAG